MTTSRTSTVTQFRPRVITEQHHDGQRPVLPSQDGALPSFSSDAPGDHPTAEPDASASPPPEDGAASPPPEDGAASPPPEDGAASRQGEPVPELMSMAEFEDAVGDALDLVPAGLMDRLDNVVFLIEDEPSEEDPELLGVYDGVPLTERDLQWGGMVPDRITIFRGPLLRMCPDREELLEEIAVTVVHEIAHHFGIDDERLHGLGWG